MNDKGADQTVGMHRLVCASLFANPKARVSHFEAYFSYEVASNEYPKDMLL